MKDYVIVDAIDDYGDHQLEQKVNSQEQEACGDCQYKTLSNRL